MDFNKDLFKKTISLLAARMKAKSIDPVRRIIKSVILTLPKIRSVAHDPADPSMRLLLLAEHIKSEADLEPSILDALREHEATFVKHDLVIDYDYYSAEEVLRKLLPEDVDVPASFETVGHLVHLNLRPEQEPFKKLIGAVILDKNPAIRTVVNKVGSIDSTFRFFRMEVLAGEPDTMVEVREEGCRFRFDYAKVYWNSRLQFEHRRLVDLFRPGHFVCDVFCGVGPFAMPAAKKGCLVYANDLNPESVRWLKDNAKLNRVKEANLQVFNLDGRQFIRNSLEALRKDHPEAQGFDHYAMNLPAIAYQFLDVIGEMLKEGAITKSARVHCYTFVKPGGDAIDNVEEGLGMPIHKETAEVKHVRTVAPNKDMFCVSFTIPIPSKRLKESEEENNE
jgi:tRNA (guanine37-N1)-methyltransferase